MSQLLLGNELVNYYHRALHFFVSTPINVIFLLELVVELVNDHPLKI